jgi:hypothetical protein
MRRVGERYGTPDPLCRQWQHLRVDGVKRKGTSTVLLACNMHMHLRVCWSASSTWYRLSLRVKRPFPPSDLTSMVTVLRGSVGRCQSVHKILVCRNLLSLHRCSGCGPELRQMLAHTIV